ncbi:TPA: hypothetical protein HA241_03015 [Candidatus Woesearchaeota archaeon]|nr:hypothetical protein [Candidatus Woesearchaeota archaeon]
MRARILPYIVSLLLAPSLARAYPELPLCEESVSLEQIVENVRTELTPDQKRKIRLIYDLNNFLRERSYAKGRAFCTLEDTLKPSSKLAGLAASRKDTFNTETEPLLLHAIDTPARIAEIARHYHPDYHDVYVYEVYTPYSQVSPSFLDLSPSQIIHLVIHERVHDEIELPRILEEAMADIASYSLGMEFLDEFQRWDEYHDDVEQNLNRQLRRAKVLGQVYSQLSALYAKKDLTTLQKIVLRQDHFEYVKQELGDTVVNNATIARELYYTRQFLLLWDIHMGMGNNAAKTIAFYQRLPGDHIDASAILDERYASIKGFYQDETTKKE